MALNAGIKRDLFIEQYLNFNFEANWIKKFIIFE